ncbi:MAG TPA: M23 family metallopeptidase [Longimicrobiaceae bacterium]|nr:M23 family metallopeptidase [Longimicrobiaceae bacterium]
MSRSSWTSLRAVLPFAAAVGVLLLGGVALSAGGHPASGPTDGPPVLLPPVRAIPVRVDTLFLGGYARGSFTEAVRTLASDLSGSERVMIGRHLDKIFLSILPADGLGNGGRLRVAYERVVRPDGTTRSIRVLAAEAAVGGELHTAFLFDGGGRPGYYDALGRSLDPEAWVRPLEHARVTSPFRIDRMHPILRRILPHNGVDYAASFGTPVRATGDGSVVYASARGGYGNLVEIQHPNGYSTRYAHLSRIAPGVGRFGMVRQGEVIGYVGMSGLATGPHLHYEVRRRGQPVDPETVAPDSGPSEDLGFRPEWRTERRQLARLLARAPTLLSVRRRGSSGD